ncbi:LysM peptidoglycan-binding domain-containing protein [Candidatus Peribacteria bacterium]|nr:LysM peptidoglycan-binding domain-containing protein [Candidatus Peribacteria bacterium]
MQHSPQETPRNTSSNPFARALMIATAATAMTLSTPSEAQGNTVTAITNLQQANGIANHLATTYTRCNKAKTVLDIQSLRAARADFQSVTLFGSTHGEGENPVDAWGNTVDWTDLAKWLGLDVWLKEHIAAQTRHIHEQQTRANAPFQAEKGANLYVPVPPCMRDNVVVQKKQAPLQASSQFQWFYMPAGGTLSQAAQYHHTSVKMLQYWNRIPDPNRVAAGRVLWVIPGVK